MKRESLRQQSSSSLSKEKIASSSQPIKYSLEFLKSKKLPKHEEFITIDANEADERLVPVYTEKRAQAQVP